MGIVNVTPDSFSDGGRFLAVEAAVDHALSLLEQGADVIDIGGESTRPGASSVAPSEEADRVLPVIESLVAQGVRSLSIDTRRAEVAEAALAAGASWINDVDALCGDGMLEIAVRADAVVLMHWRRSEHDEREDRVAYEDVVTDVAEFLAERVRAAVAAGVLPHRVLVDPGIGFGKRVQDNLALTRQLSALKGQAAGVLYGASRKRFLGALSGIADASARDPASVAAACFAAQAGADIVRVHDVRSTVVALRVFDALRREA